MIIFLIAFLLLDAVIVLSANFGHVEQAARVCQITAPMCQYPIPVFVLGVIASGMLALQKN
jgi:hypothetical protein